MHNLWTLGSVFFICFITTNAQSYNYGHGSYYAPLVPQRSTNEQHFRVVHFNPQTQPFAAQNQHYYPGVSQAQNTQAFPQQFNSRNNFGANSNQLIPAQTFKGDYISQSESSQLDQSAYPYKQRIAGNTRSFKRFVTTCYPGGRCENQKLDVGAIDQTNQNILNYFRAQIQKGDKNAAQNSISSVPAIGKTYLPPCQNQNGIAQPTNQAFTQFPSLNPVNFVQTSPQLAPQLTQLAADNTPPERRLYPYYEAVSSISFN